MVFGLASLYIRGVDNCKMVCKKTKIYVTKLKSTCLIQVLFLNLSKIKYYD